MCYANIVILQNLSRDSVLLPSIEGFGVEHDVSAVARLGARDVTLPTQLHPRHSQDRPKQTGSGFSQVPLNIERCSSLTADKVRHQHKPAVSIGKREDVMFIMVQTRHTT